MEMEYRPGFSSVHANKQIPYAIIVQAVRPLAQKSCNSKFELDQTFLNLTKFIKNVIAFISPNKYRIKTNFIINLMILIQYHNNIGLVGIWILV